MKKDMFNQELDHVVEMVRVHEFRLAVYDKYIEALDK
jgi:hypothetical protein